jgi:peptide/nickel transport system permease protein
MDPVTTYLGSDLASNEALRNQMIEKWGLNEPAPVRYKKWAGSLLKGDFGMSFFYNQPVLTIVSNGVKNSFFLMFFSWILSGLLGFAIGILAARYEDRLIDSVIKKVCYILTSTPTFWIGLILLYAFSVRFKIFPIGFSIPIGTVSSEISFMTKLRHMILPIITLSITGISHIAMHTRIKMIQVFHSPYADYSSAGGYSKWNIVFRHGLRNILLPAITLQFASISELISGSVLVENVFSYSGLGNITVFAGAHGDVPLLMGITVVVSSVVFIGNATANMLYPIIDPRIQRGAGI